MKKILLLLLLTSPSLSASEISFACMDTWRGYLSAKNLEPDEAVIQDSSVYNPKTFKFELNPNGIAGLRDEWQSYSCKRYETLGMDLLDCINKHNDSIFHLDIASGALVEWMLLSGQDWSSVVMSRGKCNQIGG